MRLDVAYHFDSVRLEERRRRRNKLDKGYVLPHAEEGDGGN